MTTPHDWDDELGQFAQGEFTDDDFDPSDFEDDEEVPISSVADVVDGSDDDWPQQLALLPDGSSAVRLTGSGAGTVVIERDVIAETTAVPFQLPTRDQILAGAAPLLLVHRPHSGHAAIPRLLGAISAATAGRVGLGVVTSLPRSLASRSAEWLADSAVASIRIADPAGFKLDTALIPGQALTARTLRWWPYLDTDPLDLTAVLEAQRIAGATLLLSPGRAVDPTDPRASLDRVFNEADAALAELQGGERMALNLTLPRSWLTSPVLRDQLLDQLLDQEQFDTWYIRVQWPSTLRSTEQPTDHDLLSGYKRLAQLASDEERTLLLPQTGLTGWLQLGFGASGFGSGLPGADQAFKEPVGGGSGAPAIERYFEPKLLHSVERTVHEALSRQPGYDTCNCPYCPALHASADWRFELAQLHQLYWTGILTADTATADRGGAPGAIRRAVRTALTVRMANPLVGPSEPRHLPVWDRLL